MKQTPEAQQYQSTCQPLLNLPTWVWGLYITVSLAIFDFIILILTLQPHLQNLKRLVQASWKRNKLDGIEVERRDDEDRDREIYRDEIIQMFFLDSVLYFSMSFCITLAEVIWVYAHRNNTALGVALAPV